MKTRIMTGILIIALVALSAGIAAAQYGQGDGDGVYDNIGTYLGCGYGGYGINFVDGDGDGVCYNFDINGRDDDNDGTPNGQDEDYVLQRAGSGYRCGYGSSWNR